MALYIDDHSDGSSLPKIEGILTRDDNAEDGGGVLEKDDVDAGIHGLAHVLPKVHFSLQRRASVKGISFVIFVRFVSTLLLLPFFLTGTEPRTTASHS